MTSPKIIAYDVVATEIPDNLGKFVNELVKQGWQPYSYPFPMGTYLIQALVKYETNATELPKSL